MKNVNVWIINHNAQPPSLGGLCRHYYFKKYSKDTSFNIKIITSSKIHNTSMNMINEKVFLKEIEVEGENFVFVKSNDYKKNSIRRKINFLSFAFKIKKLPKKLNEKPDLIYTSSPDIFAAYYSVKLAKKLKVPCVVEIRDLWPESIIEYNHTSPHNPLIKIMYKMEKWIYKHADSIVFTTEGEKQYLIDKGWNKQISLDKCYYINNGVDFSNLQFLKENYQLDNIFTNDANKINCTYIGSIRKANNVEIIVDAASILKNCPNIEFYFFGDGTEKKLLEQKCNDLNLNNCHFCGKVDKKYIPWILSKSDINILNYIPSKTLKYGGSQNKLFDYLASGKPIISTVQMNYNLIERCGCGITLKNNSSKELAEAIIELSNLSEHERNEIGIKGIDIAREFDYQNLTQRFLYVIEKTLYGKSDIEYKQYEGEKND